MICINISYNIIQKEESLNYNFGTFNFCKIKREVSEMERLEFVNELAPKNLKHYQNKINEIVDWINKVKKPIVFPYAKNQRKVSR